MEGNNYCKYHTRHVWQGTWRNRVLIIISSGIKCFNIFLCYMIAQKWLWLLKLKRTGLNEYVHVYERTEGWWNQHVRSKQWQWQWYVQCTKYLKFLSYFAKLKLTFAVQFQPHSYDCMVSELAEQLQKHKLIIRRHYTVIKNTIMIQRVLPHYVCTHYQRNGLKQKFLSLQPY